MQFHFHSPSEHTIDGSYMDLEMHTVHLAREPELGDMKYAAMGLMFSVDNYTHGDLSVEMIEIIDNFFDNLEWTTTDRNPIVPLVSYGDLMMMADMKNRWVYKGSVTTPPCATYVYWNVVRRIYPIKQHHLDKFKAQLARDNLQDIGNYREIQEYTEAHMGHVI